jgi:septum formation protein
MGELLLRKKLILGSASPRRRKLLSELGLEFDVQSISVEETYPPHLQRESIALHLAELKAMAFGKDYLHKDSLLITADTIVWHKNKNLGKPSGRPEAFEMLKMLSGDNHEVITGVCLRGYDWHDCFSSVSKVWFKNLSNKEISYYIDQYMPYDKAGAYGIQEWIGMTAVSRIEGSFFNVMGLPVQQLYENLNHRGIISYSL